MKKLALIMLTALCACSGHREAAEAAPDADSIANRISECSRIYTAEYTVSKIIVQNDEKRLTGKIFGMPVNVPVAGGKRVIAIPIEGILKAYVDLSATTPDNVEILGDSIRVTLPYPRIELTGTRVKNEEIRQQVGWSRSDFSDAELTRFQKVGRDSLLAEVPRLGLDNHARESAARALIALLSDFGYNRESITITFSDKPANPKSGSQTDSPAQELPSISRKK